MHPSKRATITIEDLKALSEETLREIRVGCRTPEEVTTFVNCALLREENEEASKIIQCVRNRIEEDRISAEARRQYASLPKHSSNEQSSLFSTRNSLFDKF
jgi:hypothetical protein